MAMLFVSIAVGISFSQVKVTFTLNTATYPDTLAKLGNVTVTGNKPALGNWGTGIALSNIGGDYWTAQISFNVGDTIEYKYRVHGNWESELDDPYGLGTPNNYYRRYIVSAKDTVLPLEFYNGTQSKQFQYWRPYKKSSEDTLVVWVRINMQAVIENKTFGWTDADYDSVAVIGDSLSNEATDFNWMTSNYLKKEINPFFFSGPIRFVKNKIIVADSVHYKFRLGISNTRSELQGKPTRKFTIPINKSDTTLSYVYFDNVMGGRCRCNDDTTVVTFIVDVTRAINEQGFNLNDTLVVQSGFFKTSQLGITQKHLHQLDKNIFIGIDTIVASLYKFFDYQYAIIKNGEPIRENYFNYDYGGISESERVYRQALIIGRSFSVYDTVRNISNPRRQPQFPSQIPLNKQVHVTWVCDIRPAYAQIKAGKFLRDIQGSRDVSNVDSIKIWGVAINGPATNLPNIFPVGDWAPWTQDLVSQSSGRKMYDDGTHGDAIADDSIYTIIYTYPAGTKEGKLYKFTIGGGDVESGSNYGVFNYHLANISDEDSVYTAFSEFGSINPKFYDAWSFKDSVVILSVTEYPDLFPNNFFLSQNFPNPFNPATTINYQIPAHAYVSLKVYDMLGREVATLVNGEQNAGAYSVRFNGGIFSSGVYICRMTAGSYSEIKRMLLIK